LRAEDDGLILNYYRYRQTVIHNLPQLEKLDNISISSQERAEAMRYGEAIEDMESVCYPTERRIEELEELRSEAGDVRAPSQFVENYQSYVDDNYNSYGHYNTTDDADRSSLMGGQVSACRAESVVSNQAMMVRREMRSEFNQAQTPDYSYQRRSAFEDNMSIKSEYQSAPKASYNSRISGRVYQQDRPDLGRLPPRPRNRNSNILSSILCLIKEIDGPSLEVVEMAVRCRMEELED